MITKKLVLTTTLIASVVCGSLSVITQKVQAEETSPEYANKDITVEVNSTEAFDQIKTSIIEEDIIRSAGIDIETVDIEKSEMIIDQIDITKIGTQEVNVIISVKPKSESTPLMISNISSKFTLHVVDTVAPVIGLKHDTLKVKLDTEFNPWDSLEYIVDNSKIDLYPNLIIENNVDTSVEGTYEVVYSVEDSASNMTTKNLSVDVKKQVYSTTGGVSSGDDINYMLQLINNVRTENGLSELSLADEAGQRAIAIRAEESVGNITHRRPDGSHYKTALTDQGVVWDHSPLEILTYSGSSVESKLNWWLNSPNHRSILLKSNYETIAIGYSGGMWAAIVY